MDSQFSGRGDLQSQGEEGLKGLQASTSPLGEHSRLGLKSPGPDSGRCESDLGCSAVSGWPAPSSPQPFAGWQPRAPQRPSSERIGAGLPCSPAPLQLSLGTGRQAGPPERPLSE